MRRKLAVMLGTVLLTVGLLGASIVSAITLAQSFSSGTSLNVGKAIFGEGTYYSKTVWAKTKGFTYKKRRHYVTVELPGYFSAYRKYGYGDIYNSKTSGTIIVPLGRHPRKYFPTGYAYYGWE